MKHGQIIPYVEKCIHLGNMLYSSSIENEMLNSAIIDLNVKTNNLRSEFSFSESIALSRLFKSFRRICRYSIHYSITRMGENIR